MNRLVILGPGYTASRIGDAVEGRGWQTLRIGRADFDAADAALRQATLILSSVPPDGEGDPVLRRYAPALAASPAWIGYLSSTGVYGDAGGAWVDETAPIGTGRRRARAAADRAWLDLGARVFRLPGIYGPGRSSFDRLLDGSAYRVDASDQLFSRVHVDDIVSGVIAAFDGPPGAYNLADDLPARQSDVMSYAAALLGMAAPPLLQVEDLPAPARAFYRENRRVANGKAKRLLGWRPAFASYREGLRDLSAKMSPASVSAPPSNAVADQR
ncbi:SDR family NAD(P)-dependent oxidoreductase [Sphingomonas sp. ID1715]|uniref:SDR family NAD(P)-dependent oxidoreductase n=1 Tax=Sphingomonas sp. ID1715 TaxID=1656898 RepID=UPI0014890BFB|nr:SDR family NAD(P)-dependent oxidoreductase [Sphingomonas sp. ID1715]NNM75936.1 SDR family NAD(P)-dependent oxidoreductase [Sphingomonas sp. ID1715]